MHTVVDFFGYLSWFIVLEERLALYLVDHNISILTREAILFAANAAMMSVEYMLIHVAVHFNKKISKIGTPKLLAKMAGGKPISTFDLFLLALTPGCQKFGVIGLYARRREFGWRGYLALCLGGFVRVAFYPLLGRYIIVLIVILFILRILDWVQVNHKR